MAQPTNQITIRTTMTAMLWAGIALALWRVMMDPDTPGGFLSTVAFILAIVVSGCASVGSLFGRTILGLKVGLSAALATVVVAAGAVGLIVWGLLHRG